MHQKIGYFTHFLEHLTVSVTFSDENIKYWRVNRKKTQLRLKTMIKNNFHVNGFQILTQIN